MRTFDRGQCEKRNRIAAKRDGINAVPLLFLSQPDSRSPLTARGALPATPEASLERINALSPDGAAPLTPDQVWLHTLEAANNQFVSDRFMFLDPSTLRNIAADAQAGFAFMNSHRSGGISHGPAELPMGRTYAGRYEVHSSDDGGRDHRTLVAMYMLRGKLPNGANGPSTDDMHEMIEGGTVFDASVGLFGGWDRCDVCGQDLDAYDPETYRMMCPHVPGTHRKMSDEDKEAQRARGVPEGYASYSLVDARPGEVSAVFDGAVPGAGFQKALAMARGKLLSPQETAQARHAYARLMTKGDLSMDVDDIVAEVGRRLGIRPRAPGGNTGDDYHRDDPPPPTNPLPVDTAEAQQLRQRLAATEAQLATERAAREKSEREQLEKQSEQFVSSLIQSRRLFPYQGKDLKASHLQAALDDRREPVSLTDHTGASLSRQAMLERLFGAGEQHPLTEQLLPGTPPKDAVALGHRAGSELEEIQSLREEAAEHARKRNERDQANASRKGGI